MKKLIVSMKQGAQKGFTLIELMIVITIIGVIAAFAVPMFQDYTVRTRLAEGLVMASSLKSLIVDNAASGMPLDDGWDANSFTPTKNIQSIEFQNGFIYITGTAAADNIVLSLSPSTLSETGSVVFLQSGVIPHARITWTCSAGDAAGASGGRSSQIPTECR